MQGPAKEATNQLLNKSAADVAKSFAHFPLTNREKHADLSSRLHKMRLHVTLCRFGVMFADWFCSLRSPGYILDSARKSVLGAK